MKKVLPLFAFSFLMFSAPVNAFVVDPYISAGIGLGNQRINHETHSTMTFSGEMGIDVPFVRMGIEYNHLNVIGGHDDVSIQSAMLNAYFKPIAIPLVKPYFGAGYGRLFEKSANAYQGMIGMQIDIPVTNLYIDVEARALYSDDAVRDHNLWHYDFRIKLRYNLW